MHTTRQILTASFASLALFGLAACSEKPAPSAATDAGYIEQSRSTVAALQQQLSTELKSAIQTKGVVEAIQVCANVAQPITAAVGAETSEQHISRTALRVRNPANQPDALSQSILQNWQTAMDTNGTTPEPVVNHEGDRVIVHHPIILIAGCLACHGDPTTIAPEVAQKLASLYPEDKATGFAVGDLRGAFRVVFEN
ncbi:Tll0287-like domain-containing protein [Coraliomargarita sp. W4R72]